MLVQIVGLSVVLVATLIILFVCISGNINLKMEVDKLKRQNDSLRFNIICVCEENKRLAIKLKKPPNYYTIFRNRRSCSLCNG